MKPFTLAFMLSVAMAFAQAQYTAHPPIPVEVMTGHHRLYCFTTITRPIDERFGFFAVNTILADYKGDLEKNEWLTNLLINYKISGRFGAAGGMSVNHAVGLNSFGGIQYLFVNESWLVVLVPGALLGKFPSMEVFGMAEFKPVINPRLKWYSRMQTMYNASQSFREHNRSYAYFRVGISWKKITGGPAFNWDFYGPEKIQMNNFGMFVRMEM